MILGCSDLHPVNIVSVKKKYVPVVMINTDPYVPLMKQLVLFYNAKRSIRRRGTIFKLRKYCFSCFLGEGVNDGIICGLLGCSFGGRGDKKIPTHQELPELFAHP